MKIGILGAMDQEVALLKESLDQLAIQEIAHLTFYTGTLHGVDVVLVKCGIGKVAAAVATTSVCPRCPHHPVSPWPVLPCRLATRQRRGSLHR